MIIEYHTGQFTASYKHIKLIINFMKKFYYKKASLIQYPTDVYSCD